MQVIRLNAERLPVNGWPVNQIAKKWLLRGKLEANQDTPYLLQLVLRGLEEAVPIPGPAEQYRWHLETAAGRMLSPKLDPVEITRWFTNNPDGPDDPAEQSATLEIALSKAGTWEEAAQVAMEAFYDRIAAENDHFRSG